MTHFILVSVRAASPCSIRKDIKPFMQSTTDKQTRRHKKFVWSMNFVIQDSQYLAVPIERCLLVEALRWVFSAPAVPGINLGIWYKNISVRTVVWVANREIPLLDSSSVLTIINPGILALVNGTGSIIWFPNMTGSTRDPVARLMESGNLVVQDANDESGHFLWQSFDYPCDTLLPGMKLGKNFVTGLERHLSSWKSSDDPAPGEFTYRCDPQGFPQNILRSGPNVLFRTGPWNGIRFSGRPNLQSNTIYTFELVYTKEEVYYDYKLLSSVVSRMVLSHIGVLQRMIIGLTSLTDNCDTYKLCGPNGNCNVGNNPVYWSNGCVRRTPLDCHNGDGFVKYPGYKMPDTWNSWFDRSMTLRECEIVCLKNCSCMAYANLDIRRGGRGCLLWFDELIDMRELNANEQDVYIRMASSELVHSKKREIVAVTLALLIGLLLLGLSLIEQFTAEQRSSDAQDLELPLFDLTVIGDSTNNFSIDNKLGEGGFGAVYKMELHNNIKTGILKGGQEIAVKRLSKYSSQGLDESKNEVICIAKLQHRNLVKASRMLHSRRRNNYAIDGLFLVKSDVFIFGVLVLEIVSRKKNRGFYHLGHRLNLLGHAWNLYKEEKPLELIDEAQWESCNQTEMLRSIHVGLLCAQECPTDRPSMSFAVMMLGSEVALPQAK
ncbi:unnamed protein product [Camellia sinensis]